MTTVAAVRQVVFADGLPGFEDLHRFVLEPLADGSPFSLLRAVDGSVEFVVVSPQVLYPDYDIELDDDAAAGLALTHADDALVLAIVTLGDTLAASTVNLLGPVIVNVATSGAAQVILNGTTFSTKAPLRVA